MFSRGAGRFGHSKMYMDSFIRWIEDMHSQQGIKMRILTVKYGLAPKCQYPGQINSVGAAYKYLVKSVNINPQNIVFGLYSLFICSDPAGSLLYANQVFVQILSAGDSMGGHLCLSTL